MQILLKLKKNPLYFQKVLRTITYWKQALSNSDENRPCMDSPLYNEVPHLDASIIEENTENLYGSPAKKLKVVEASSNSSESQGKF